MSGLEQFTGRGFAILCDGAGKILQVLHNSFDESSRISPGEPWFTIVDEHNIEKAQNFVQEINLVGAAFNWDLNVRIKENALSICFAGIILDDKQLIVAAKTNESLQKLVREFSKIGNEQVNALRIALKENVELRARTAKDSSDFDEISRLNNELVNLQRSLAKKNIQLEQLNEEKNRFLGIAAHDLRNPLSNVFILAEFIEEEIGESNQSLHQYVQQIRGLSRFMLNLVDDLLDISAIESGKIELNLELVDLIDLAKQCIELNQMLAEKKQIKIHFESSTIKEKLVIDRGKISQVINNLLTNAVKYSEEKTRIIIRLKESNDDIIVSVEDQGLGISPHELKLLFNPFQKTSTQSTGGESSTGLGLYIVKRIVEAHQGKIWAESELKKGSVFSFSLPN